MKTISLLVVGSCAVTLGRLRGQCPEGAHQRPPGIPARQRWDLRLRSRRRSLHIANQALAKAEQSFRDDSDSYKTRDLAYVAERKAQMAEAIASITTEQKLQAQSQSDYQATQGAMVGNARQD